MKSKRNAKKRTRAPRPFSSLQLEANSEGTYVASHAQLENINLSDLPFGKKVCLLASDAPRVRSSTMACPLAYEAVGKGQIRVHAYYYCSTACWGLFLDFITFVNVAWRLLKNSADLLKNLHQEQDMDDFGQGYITFYTKFSIDVPAGPVREMEQSAWKILNDALRPLHDYEDEVVRTVWKKFRLKPQDFPLEPWNIYPSPWEALGTT
jgi:hypothetical protein